MTTSIEILFKTLGCFIAIVGFSIYLEAPKKYLIRCGMVSALGGLIYLIFINAGYSDFISTFWSTVGAVLLANIFARLCKTPVTLFLIAGILPIVPGAGMYYSVYYLLNDQESVAAGYLLNTVKTAGVIALSIILVDTVFKTYQKIQNSKKIITKKEGK